MSLGYLVIGIALLVAGLLMILIDVTHPGIFLIIPAAVLMAIGFILILDSDLFTANPIAASLIVIAAAFGGAAGAIPVYRRIAPTHPTIPTSIDSLQRQTAQVVVDVMPGTMKGKVRLRGEVWSATSDEPIPRGETVMVVGGEGVTLKVVRTQAPEAPPSSSAEPA